MLKNSISDQNHDRFSYGGNGGGVYAPTNQHVFCGPQIVTMFSETIHRPFSEFKDSQDKQKKNYHTMI